ncbi:MAG: OmpA family protein [Candidatus Binatia bacterium]
MTTSIGGTLGGCRRNCSGILGLILLLATVSACASGPLTTRERHTGAGAALGAGAGAIIGSARGDAAEGAVIGGALGALSGAMLGDQAQAEQQRRGRLERRLEVQERELARNRRLIARLRARNIDATQSDRGVVVTLPDVLFEFGSASLTRSAKRKTRDIAEILLKEARGRRVLVEGHTDSIGAVLYNQGLSERRARVVAMALESHGVSPALLESAGYGEKYPVAANTNPDGSDNASGRARNRRVEIVILN